MSVELAERPLISTEFSDWLANRMRERGMDTAHLAAYTDRPYMTAQRWLKGTAPTSENCYLIAKALGRDPREVLARAGHLRLDPEHLKVLELGAKMDQLSDQVSSVLSELRQSREEMERLRTERPEFFE